MSRWDALPNANGNVYQRPTNNPTIFMQNAAVDSSPVMTSLTGTNNQEVYQHGTIGDFVRQEIEGAQSGFIRCVYTAKHTANNTVTLMCEKAAGCCKEGCCPKDQFWMAGVFVLLAFVLLVFVVGTVLMIVCYQRSKSRQRREEKDAAANAAAYDYNYATSQVGMPATPGAYSSYGGPTY